MRGYRLKLGYPPTVNGLYTMSCRIVNGKKKFRKFPTKKAKSYMSGVAADCAKQGVRKRKKYKKYQIDIQLYPPDRSRRDIDNTLKALIDGLQMGGCFNDDVDVWKITAERREVKRGGAAYVKVEPYSREDRIDLAKIHLHNVLHGATQEQKAEAVEWLREFS